MLSVARRRDIGTVVSGVFKLRNPPFLRNPPLVSPKSETRGGFLKYYQKNTVFFIFGFKDWPAAGGKF